MNHVILWILAYVLTVLTMLSIFVAICMTLAYCLGGI